MVHVLPGSRREMVREVGGGGEQEEDNM